MKQSNVEFREFSNSGTTLQRALSGFSVEVRDEDSFGVITRRASGWEFWPEERLWAIPPFVLRAIADKVDELNAQA